MNKEIEITVTHKTGEVAYVNPLYQSDGETIWGYELIYKEKRIVETTTIRAALDTFAEMMEEKEPQLETILLNLSPGKVSLIVDSLKFSRSRTEDEATNKLLFETQQILEEEIQDHKLISEPIEDFEEIEEEIEREREEE